MLCTRSQLELTDICCRIISDGPVTLEERIWMNKLIEDNSQARELAENILEWRMLMNE